MTKSLHTAHSLYHKGKYQEALRLGEAIYCKDPSDVDNLLLLAASHFQLKHIHESKFYAAQSVAVDQSLVEGHIAVGRCLVEMGDFSLAIDLYNRALQIQPRFAEAYALLGCAHLRLGRLKESVDCFEVAISLKPNLVEASANCAIALQRLGDVDAAKQILKRSKHTAIIMLHHGNIFHRMQDFDSAIQNYSRALKLEPSFHDGEMNLCGSILERYKVFNDKSNLEDVVYGLERLTSKGVKSAHSLLGICHAFLGNTESSIEHLYYAMGCEPPHATILCNLGVMLFKKGCLRRSAHLCFRALKTKSNCPQAFNLIGLIIFQLGNISLADKCFNVAMKLQPNNPCSSIYIGATLLHQDQPIAATRMLKKAIAANPNDNLAFLHLGNGE